MTTAIGKVVAVVEALSEERRITAISRSTGLPVSTVHRILQELVQVGWVREDDDRGYLFGPRLLGLAGRAGDHTTLTRIAGPYLAELCEITGHAVHFAVRSGDEVVYIDKLEGSRAYRMRSRIGLAIPLHCTAIGKALLARLPTDEVRAIAARAGLPARTTHTITSPDQLVAHLAGIRQRGYSIDDEENELQIRCVGAAVSDHARPIGGISLSMLAFELTEESLQQVAPLVVRAAGSITAALGGQT